MALSEQIERDYEALTERCAIVARPQERVLALIGDEAAEFLQGQVTNDVAALAAGEGCYAALLTPKGKMRAEMRVVRTENELLILADAPRMPVIQHTVQTYRIGYRFDVEDRGASWSVVSLIGPESAAAFSGAPQIEHANASVAVAGAALIAVGTDVGVDLVGPAETVAAAREALLDRGLPPAGEQAAEVVRVERGRPRMGSEIDDDTIPQEAGLNERAVNFEKGCYVGQETVARLHYKGKPNRHLRGLVLDGDAEAGDTVSASGGREVGRLGTVVDSPRHGRVALAILRREVAPGDTVDVAGTAARVCEPGDFNV